MVFVHLGQRRIKMVEPVVVTLFPIVFLIILFGGGELMKRRNIDIDGTPPIGKKVFLTSKYAILVLWAAMIVQSWGVNMSLIVVTPWLRGFSIFMWVCGFMLLLIGRLGMADSFRIGSPKETTGLKTKGLFSCSRNPMYLGVYSTILACILYTLNPVFLALGVFIVVVHHKIVLAEEKHLQNIFGREYADYCGRVRRYI
jgi:protein-S-isoprenylcysteine O-methyltransferase Ste14